MLSNYATKPYGRAKPQQAAKFGRLLFSLNMRQTEPKCLMFCSALLAPVSRRLSTQDKFRIFILLRTDNLLSFLEQTFCFSDLIKHQNLPPQLHISY